MPVLVAKATLLLLVGAAVHRLVRVRGSAAAGHLICTAAVTALLVLPLSSLLLPTWELAAPSEKIPAPIVELLETGKAPGSAPGGPSAVPAADAVPGPLENPVGWQVIVLALYLAGALLLVGRIVLERISLARIVAEADCVSCPQWMALLRRSEREMGVRRPVKLLRARGRLMPMTSGTRRPVIVIPATSDAWSQDRRRAVILHEVAHVARRDCFVQMLAALAGALYWFHPGVWWAAAKLRVEREMACDDRVIAAGVDPRDYARHLLEIARTTQAAGTRVLGMSAPRRSQLEVRMRAVLDAARVRAAPGPAARGGVGFAAFFLLAVISGAQPVRVPITDAFADVVSRDPFASGLAGISRAGAAAVPKVQAADEAAQASPLPPIEDELSEVVTSNADREAPVVREIPAPSPCVGGCDLDVAAPPNVETAESRFPRSDVTSPAAARPTRRRADLITREEIATLPNLDVYRVVRTLRPTWTTAVPSASRGPVGITIYLDGRPQRSLQDVVSVPISSVETIQYLSSTGATTRWGSDPGGAAISITTVQR